MVLQAIDERNCEEIKPQPVEAQLETDASELGRDAKLDNLEAKGDWNSWVACQLSNYKELLAVLLVWVAFKYVLYETHYLLMLV